MHALAYGPQRALAAPQELRRQPQPPLRAHHARLAPPSPARGGRVARRASPTAAPASASAVGRWTAPPHGVRPQPKARFSRCTRASVTANEDMPLPQVAQGNVALFLDALWRFSRPHTIYGTAISVVSISLLAVRDAGDLHTAMLVGLAQALASALLMNVSIVGLNQLYDVEIDKVNKPYLPVACGDLTPNQGAALVGGSAALALLIGATSGSAPLLATLTASLVLGVLYSAELPFLRWKRYPFLAAACIFSVRAVLVQLGFYLHMRVSVLQAAAVYTQPLLFATAFMCLCSVVIALFKDIPDVAGDMRANVRTLSVRLGVERVFNICRGVMLVAYTGAIIAGLCGQSTASCLVTGTFHAAMAAEMWRRSQKVDLTSSKALYEFYMFIWKLFYAEYLVLPLLR